MFSLLRGSGLKYEALRNDRRSNVVLPLTREWIEITKSINLSAKSKVLPLTREWIEIIKMLSALVI